MLAEERQNRILQLVENKLSVTLPELMNTFGASESTIRRDLLQLHKEHKLVKVYGGATAIGQNYHGKDDDYALRRDKNIEEKIRIAQYAANLIEPEDFVFIDGGTTTSLLIDYIEEKKAVYLTNAPEHAKKLAMKGCGNSYILGGRYKVVTEANVGAEAVLALEKYNFTKGFFGTNGVTMEHGFTTPEIEESLVKKTAMSRTRQSYVLCDSSKFDQISPVCFGEFEKAHIITNKLDNIAYHDKKNITEV
ncbi:MAG: DeoR/GlpR family DNA-binding transcription regulator [Hespellia sp.]|nr:DeoR/GlpR family DNA-binding transcription regulator [Hespellia sp.]